MIKTILRGVKLLVTLAGVFIGVLLLIFIVTLGVGEQLKSKDLSQIKGTWLVHDGDEQLYGMLALRVTQDSAYFGDRIFADGRPDSIRSVGTVLHITKDSLKLHSKHSYNRYAWKLDALDENQLVLIGDSYTYNFTRQRTPR